MEEPVRGETTGLAAGIKSANAKKKNTEKNTNVTFSSRSLRCAECRKPQLDWPILRRTVAALNTDGI